MCVTLYHKALALIIRPQLRAPNACSSDRPGPCDFAHKLLYAVSKTLFPCNVTTQSKCDFLLCCGGVTLAAASLVRKIVDLLDLSQHVLEINLQIGKQAIVEAKDPAVDNGVVVLLVRLLNGGRLDDVAALLDDVELDEAVVTLLLVGDGVELVLVQTVDVANVSQPRIEKAEVLGCHGSLDTTAAIVAADDDVLDAKVTHGIVNDAHDIEIGVDDEVGNVAVDKGLAGLQTSNLLGGDTGVTASDPEVVGGLASAEADKVTRVLLLLLGGPFAVVLKDAVVRLLEVFLDVLGGRASHNFGF